MSVRLDALGLLQYTKYDLLDIHHKVKIVHPLDNMYQYASMYRIYSGSLTVAMETTANATMEVKRTKRASCSLIPIRIVRCLPWDPEAVGRLSRSIAFCPWIPSPFPSSVQVESLGAIFAMGSSAVCAALWVSEMSNQ